MICIKKAYIPERKEQSVYEWLYTIEQRLKESRGLTDKNIYKYKINKNGRSKR